MKELVKIQSELKAPKNQFNSFGKYKYRSCEDILEAVKPLLLKYECTLTLHDAGRNKQALTHEDFQARLLVASRKFSARSNTLKITSQSLWFQFIHRLAFLISTDLA